jgi:hypothetical protein
VLEVEKRAEQSGEADGALDGNEAIAGVCEGGDANGFRHSHNDGWVLEELMWTMFCNGNGCAARCPDCRGARLRRRHACIMQCICACMRVCGVHLDLTMTEG